ncbi:MAG: trimeric intracellular cation channel family protein [Selenomonas sp.]|uniref:trimeric intracellular cation channel family protein n=1 Tax=Selenomonas sp. TaxID=2053611 RepID=UPI0025D10A94|nr:trimeric intracellular cation channel family protein [Selenomonas sp.]MCR5758151.1 trimeric intracellular cation channel family protein [Selenomonas sp.]
MDSLTWVIFDIMGTIAFAVSGAMVAIQRRMDIFGIIVLAALTAVGGGMVRDVLAGITPPVALCNITDFMLSIIIAIVVSLGYSFCPFSALNKNFWLVVYNMFDTVGLASFTITGMLTGLSQEAGNPYVLPVLLGVITAVGGGILRDLMAHRMPAVLYKDVYATAALFGAMISCGLQDYTDSITMSWICFVLVIGLRFSALYFGWHLFHPRANWHRR